MKIIYYSYRSTFAAYMAACFHIGIYRQDRLPAKKVIDAHFLFSVKSPDAYGGLIYVGIDENYREVYCVGCKRHGDVVERALNNIRDIFKIDEELHFINVMKSDRIITCCIIYLYRVMRNNRLSKFLFKLWFNRMYKHYGRLLDGSLSGK